MGISAQISLYPLGKDHLTEDISEFVTILQKNGLRCDVGRMSTTLYGDADAVFDALKEAYIHVASRGACVMVSSISNACPV
jgi:uncharacterized protein YqgV (UPF0045/DUF77 family)